MVRLYRPVGRRPSVASAGGMALYSAVGGQLGAFVDGVALEEGREHVDRQVGDPVEQADAQPADLYSYGPI